MAALDGSVRAAIAQRVLGGAQVFGSVAIPVRGASMAPTFADGAIVTMTAGAADAYAPGDVVVVRRGGGMIVHRIVDRTRRHVVTRGDARFAPDPPVPVAAILGRVEGGSPARPNASRRARFVAGAAVTGCAVALRIDPRAAAQLSRLLTRIERGPLLGALAARFGRSRRTDG